LEKDINSIVVNKFIKNLNYAFVLYKEEFVSSLQTLSQDVLNEIKFLTQKYSLGAKVQYRYISKKFPNQILYNCDLYNANRKSMRSNAADM
ncbi:37652_t:CDS:1, partial [Gigaspora margarita]